MVNFLVFLVCGAVVIFIAIKADRQLQKKKAEQSKKGKDGQTPKINKK
jgi:hypothetical protein